MRVLTVTSLFPNAEQPHRGVFVRERVKRLVQYEPVEVTVIAPVPWLPSRSAWLGRYGVFSRVPRAESFPVEGDGLRVVNVQHPRFLQIPKIGSAISPLSFASAVLSAIRKNNVAADIVDAHFLFPDGAAAVLVARRLGLPVVLTARGSDVNIIPNEIVGGRWIRWALRSADALVAVSRDLAERMRVLSRGRSVAVIRNGVDMTLFHDRRDRTLLRDRLGMNAFTLLSVGNLIDLKGHDLAIKAVARLTDANLIVIGDGPRSGELTALVDRLGIASRVRLLPSMAQTDLAEHYAAADGLILASSHEGMPNVVLESLASGTPVIATPTGGALEVVATPEAGLICERDADAIAAAIERLRSRNIDRARVRATVACFDWRGCAAEVFEVFDRAVGHREAEVAQL